MNRYVKANSFSRKFIREFFFVIATLNKSNSNQQGKNYLKTKTATLNFFHDICETDLTTSHLSIYIFFFSKTNRPILYIDFSVWKRQDEKVFFQLITDVKYAVSFTKIYTERNLVVRNPSQPMHLLKLTL